MGDDRKVILREPPSYTIGKFFARLSRSIAYTAILKANGRHFAINGEVRRGTPARVLRWIDLALEFGR